MDELKNLVVSAMQQQKKLDKINETMEQLSRELVETLGKVAEKISTSNGPILIRYGNKFYQVTQSSTYNPAEPIEIREAKVVG